MSNNLKKLEVYLVIKKVRRWKWFGIPEETITIYFPDSYPIQHSEAGYFITAKKCTAKKCTSEKCPWNNPPVFYTISIGTKKKTLLGKEKQSVWLNESSCKRFAELILALAELEDQKYKLKDRKQELEKQTKDVLKSINSGLREVMSTLQEK